MAQSRVLIRDSLMYDRINPLNCIEHDDRLGSHGGQEGKTRRGDLPGVTVCASADHDDHDAALLGVPLALGTDRVELRPLGIASSGLIVSQMLTSKHAGRVLYLLAGLCVEARRQNLRGPMARGSRPELCQWVHAEKYCAPR